jgi:hypothetical protein
MSKWSEHFKDRPELSDLYTQIQSLYKALDDLINAVEKADGDPMAVSNALSMAKIIRKAHNDGEDEI